MLVACRSLSCSSPKALTATGTSWMDSLRRRAVTVTWSSVVASVVAPGAGAGALSCDHAYGADTNSAAPTARLKCLRFMGLPSSRV